MSIIFGILALTCASAGAVTWYRSTHVQKAFVFLGLSLFAVPMILRYAFVPSFVSRLVLLVIPQIYPELWTRSSSTTLSGRQYLSPYPFVLALAYLLIGGLAFIVGLGAAFSRAGNWSNYLAEFGIVLFFLAALANVVAFEAGCMSLSREKLFHRWLPFSFVGLLLTIYFAFVAIRL